ncbi:M48 family metalloprotease [Nocardia coubleae]|uniref:M48 family metalloprotease n=1 Tax=Nocardia coubleae TaxID=356147 RepID=A0A846W248_9NOCA|nr:M48 family metalloprotease [Nocardia coubleae]NKX86963.1 M48 family metalloprotease [Nocardia coubleae]
MGRIRETAGGLALTLPSVALNGVLVYVVIVGFGLWAAIIMLVLWTGFGCGMASALWFHPNRGRAAAAYGFRKPVGSEPDILATAWAEVTRKAGVDGWPYSLWVQQSATFNAFAAPARMVAVTSWAIESLRPRQLAAVLAHELSHHLMLDPRVRLLDAWFSVPTRVVRGIGAVPARAARGPGTLRCLARAAIATALLVAVAFFLTPRIGGPAVAVLIALLVLEPLTAAARARRGEFAADRMAVHLGYGRELHGALRRWLPHETAHTSALLAARARWLDTHPPIRQRLKVIRRTAAT